MERRPLTSYELSEQGGGYTEEEIDCLHNIVASLPRVPNISIVGQFNDIEYLCVYETIERASFANEYEEPLDWLVLKEGFVIPFENAKIEIDKVRSGGLISCYDGHYAWQYAYEFVPEYCVGKIKTLRKKI